MSLGCTGAHAQGADETVRPTPDWQTSSPEEQGIDSADLATLVAFGKTKSFDSFLVVRHGKIVLDAYYAPYAADVPHVINSATKAIVSSLIAVVRKDGLLDGFDHPVPDLFTDRDVANVDERKKAITIQNLLDMTSGLDWDEGFQGGKEQSLVDMRRSPDWIKFVLTSASLRTSLPTASRGEGYLSLLLEVVCDRPAASGER
jgi:CubicO group peptidase (beta-lactamase class C family)